MRTPEPSRTPTRTPSHGARGQVVIIFAGAMLLFVLLAATVIDLSWYWTNNLRMQRAADSAALAGVVFLPGNVPSAYTAARAEAAKNGYVDGVGGIVVTPVQDPVNDRRLNVTIDGPVNTFFARAVGITAWPAQRTSKADFVLPVPMGSPENYIGVGYLIKPVTTSVTTYSSSSGNSDWLPAGSAVSGQWSNAGNAAGTSSSANDNSYATEDTNGQLHVWNTFRMLNTSSPPTNPRPRVPALTASQTMTIDGIQVRLTDVGLGGSGSSTSNCRIGVNLSWDGGSGISSQILSDPITSTSTDPSTDLIVGSATSTAGWGSHTWTRSELDNTTLQARLTWVRNSNATCSTTRTVKLDLLEVRVSYTITTATTTTNTTLQQVNVTGPGGQALTQQKFWTAMQSQGAPSVQGDAYMTKYEVRKSSLNAINTGDPDARYAWNEYYNYAVEIPAGASNGAIWVYDAGFCDGTTTAGTGENWTVGAPNGNGTRQPISAYFDVYDTQETLSNSLDDTLISGTGSSYRRLSYQDHVIYSEQGDSTTVGDCSSQSWHFGWTQIASGLAGGTYRVHTYSTDPTSLGDQDDSTGLNAFAIYANATGGSPRVYGLGAMEAYVRLPGGAASEFYLAQIDAVHAGKTMIINLWDPGDTGSLSADLQILQPTGSGFSPATFSYQGTRGSSAGTSGCNSLSGTTTSVRTNTGGTSLYNGCWLTLEIALPTTYTAPADPVSGEDGWWKIRYTMGGASTAFSTDLTTWQVSIRGNPVHLVLP